MKVLRVQKSWPPVPPVVIELEPDEAAMLYAVLSGNNASTDQQSYNRGMAQVSAQNVFTRLGFTPASDKAVTVMFSLHALLAEALK